MSKQNNFRLSKTKNNILYIFSGASLALFAGLMLFPTIAESTRAEKQSVTSDDITITFSTDVVTDIKTSEYDNYKIVKDTVSVSTDSWIDWGFTVFVSADDSDIYLGGDTSSASKISGIDGTYLSPKPLEANTWGWAAPGVGRFDDAYSVDSPNDKSRFAAMPQEDTIILDRPDIFGFWNGQIDTDVYYGFKLDDDALEPGNYATTVKYTVVPQKDKPLTAKAILGDNGNLNFVYDRNEYPRGTVYTDNLGETTAVSYTNVPEYRSCTSSSDGIWLSGATSINFDASFINFKPTSTCGWFAKLSLTGGMTNPENLNTSQVTDMSYMFYQARRTSPDALSLNLGGWNTGNVTDMSYMFYFSGSYNIAAWNVSGLDDWDTGNVTNMKYMFSNSGSDRTTTSWVLDGLSSWDTGSVTDMSHMFDSAGEWATTWSIGDLSGWDTGNVTSAYMMFNHAGVFANTAWDIGDLGSWNTSKITNMSYMFYSAGWNAATWNIGDLKKWDTGNVTDMSFMFYMAGGHTAVWDIGDLSGWNTSNVANMKAMFSNAGCTADTWNLGDLSGWDTSKVTDMSHMFSNAGSNADVWDIGNLGYVDEENKGWDTSNVTNMSFMFQDAGLNATYWNIGDISGWAVSKDTQHYQFINLNTHQSNVSVVNNQPNWN